MTNTGSADADEYLDQGLAAARQAARDLARCDDRSIRSVLDELAQRTMAKLRAGLGLLIFSSAVLGFYNIVRTLFGKTGASS